jgi:phosphohistidine phosphatase
VLTIEGAIKARKVLSIAKYTFNVELDRIISSPYKRALETAEIAKELLEPRKPKIISDDALAPEKSPYEAYSSISKLKFGPADRVLVVSHQPLIGEMISDLIASDVKFGFAPGSMARIDIGGTVQSRSGTLIWLISSEVL